MTFEEWWSRTGLQLDCVAQMPENPVHVVHAAWQAAQPKWRPIETIPTDGRRVLVYRPLAHKTGDEQIAAKHAQGGSDLASRLW